MSDIISFMESNGLEVYYEPALHWLPQRRFADEAEAVSITTSQGIILAESRHAEGPFGAIDGYLHATPLVAGPPGCDLATRARKWIAV